MMISRTLILVALFAGHAPIASAQEDVSEPARRRCNAPPCFYPPTARLLRLEATCAMLIDVTAEGDVSQISGKCDTPLTTMVFRQAAFACAAAQTFYPAAHNGERVAFEDYEFEVVYKLQRLDDEEEEEDEPVADEDDCIV